MVSYPMVRVCHPPSLPVASNTVKLIVLPPTAYCPTTFLHPLQILTCTIAKRNMCSLWPISWRRSSPSTSHRFTGTCSRACGRTICRNSGGAGAGASAGDRGAGSAHTLVTVLGSLFVQQQHACTHRCFRPWCPSTSEFCALGSAHKCSKSCFDDSVGAYLIELPTTPYKPKASFGGGGGGGYPFRLQTCFSVTTGRTGKVQERRRARVWNLTALPRCEQDHVPRAFRKVLTSGRTQPADAP